MAHKKEHHSSHHKGHEKKKEHMKESKAEKMIRAEKAEHKVLFGKHKKK